MFPFVGPSYALATRAADVQRSVNLYPAPVESGSGKSQFMLQSVPGLQTFCAMVGEGRGCYEINGRAFCVVGNGLYEVSTLGAATLRGTLSTVTGAVDFDANSLELFLVDGVTGYRLTLATNTFAVNSRVASIGGSRRTAYLDQYAIYAPVGSKFFLSALAASGTIDDLDFASAEAMPDELVSFVVCNRQLYLFGSKSGEIWLNTGAADFPMQRYDGMVMSVGCIAPYSARVLSGAPVWLGSDNSGSGSVWMANGYQPQRISTRAVEEALKQSTDLSAATAYVHQWRGSYFYCLNAPGLDTTWVFDALTQSWHERAEFPDGAYAQHRVMGCMTFAGRDLALGSDGVLYEWSADAHSNDGDTLVRERISPHNATQESRRLFFGGFVVDCDRGAGGVAMLRYSNDGGATWSDWRQRSLGALGKYRTRVMWQLSGSSRDRVWHLRCTDAVPFNVVHAFAEDA
jgi:hypothetical protein